MGRVSKDIMGRVKRLKPTIQSKDNKLTGLDILKESEKYDQLERVTFDDERYTEILTNISNVKIQEMLNSFFQFSNELQMYRKEEGLKQVDDAELLDFLNLHIVLHMTTLAVEIPENIAGKVDLFTKLMKHDILEQLFESFLKSDIEKIYDRFYKTMEKYQELIRSNKEYRKAFKEKVKEMNLSNENVIDEVMFDGKLHESDDDDEDGEVSGEKNV